MAVRRFVALFGIWCALWSFALSQSHPLLSSGPMLGYAEMTEVAIWVQTSQEATVQTALLAAGQA
jgi:hypothetical protein